MELIVSPSLLSADFAVFGSECKRMEECGADWLHIDVMDGHFVPNITFGAPVVRKIRPYSDLPFDVHLMISEPMKYISDFAEAGADFITFHAESSGDARQIIEKIHSCGCKAGMALKPATPAEAVEPFIDSLDMILIMTVEPGFGGQTFMESMMPKLRSVSSKISGRGIFLQVDGGINLSNVRTAAQNGADAVVAGSSIFSALQPEKVIEEFHKF